MTALTLPGSVRVLPAVWQVQEAKNRLSELIDAARTSGPQVITRHGKAVAQVVAMGPTELPDSDAFVAHLLAMPRAASAGREALVLPKRRSRKTAIELG